MKFPSNTTLNQARALVETAIEILAKGCGEKLTEKNVEDAAEDLVDHMVNDLQQGCYGSNDS